MFAHPFGHHTARKDPKPLSVCQRNVRAAYRILLIIIAVQVALLALTYWIASAFGAALFTGAIYQSCQDAAHCTLLVDQQPTTVTIANLAAPNPDAVCARERAHADAALARLTELLATATNLELTDLQPTGPASVTARILVDSEDVTILLTESGHASFRAASAPDWCQR